MPQLVAPVVRVRTSFVVAMAEFAAEGRGGPGDVSMIGSDIRRYGGRWHRLPVFEEYVTRTRADADEASPRPAGHVPSTTLWYVEGDSFLGRICVRHRLNPALLEWGGLVGYDMRPTARRRGHATAMLRAVLPVAAGLGLESVLVTCDHDNTASRKVIEAGGGVFEDRRGKKLRYWIDATAAGRGRTGE